MNRLVGSVARALYVAYGGVVSAAIVVALWLTNVFVRRPRWAVGFQRGAARVLLACLGVRLVVRGAWPAKDGSARLFVVNHSSYLDIALMLAVLDRDFAFVTKSDLLGWPLFARITRSGAHIPVDRARLESRGAVVARIIKTLRAGRSVLVFPEGTFSHDASLRPFHAGAFHAAVAAGAPVVPLATKGVAAVWSQHAAFPRPGRVEISVGEGLGPATGSDDSSAAMEALRVGAERFIAARSGIPAAPRQYP